MAQTILEKQKNTFNALKDMQGYTNPLEAPRLVKVVVSTGTGKIQDKNKIDVIIDRLARITGQQPAPRAARLSIASFKLREGDVIGYQVTLRGNRMKTFLDKLIHITLPRTKDFRGLSKKAIDEMGNMTIGIKEHTVFPETADEELKDIFGLAVTVVTTAKSKEEAEKFFEYLGFPFKKEEEKK